MIIMMECWWLRSKTDT